MSAFVGPIHHWLYRKIQFQESLVQFLAKEHTGLLGEATKRYGALAIGPLEENIDEGNIHGWLQEQIKIVEKRLAFVFNELKKTKKEERLFQDIDTFARKYPIKKRTPKEVFDELQNVLVDGMPCDRVNTLLFYDDNSVLWETKIDLHTPYWQEVKANGEDYFKIRTHLIQGMINPKYTYIKQQDNSYKIERL